MQSYSSSTVNPINRLYPTDYDLPIPYSLSTDNFRNFNQRNIKPLIDTKLEETGKKTSQIGFQFLLFFGFLTFSRLLHDSSEKKLLRIAYVIAAIIGYKTISTQNNNPESKTWEKINEFIQSSLLTRDLQPIEFSDQELSTIKDFIPKKIEEKFKSLLNDIRAVKDENVILIYA